MSWNVNKVIQLLLLVSHLAAESEGLIPPKYKIWAVTAQGAAQFALSRIAAHRNPDGTPAEFAYKPPLKGASSGG